MKTKEEVLAELKKDGTSSMIVNRMGEMMNQFATVDAFFRAMKSDLDKAYNRLTPNGKSGLGKAFYSAYDRARVIYMDSDRVARKEEPRKEAKNDSGMDEFYSLEQLKSVVAIMELSYIESVNLRELVGIIRSIKIRQAAKKASAGEAGGHEVAGKGEIVACAKSQIVTE